MQDIIIKKRDYFKSRFKTALNMILFRNNVNNLKNGYPNLAVFAFDHIGHSIAVDGIYEREELQIISEWLSKNNLIRGVALDIGANIGNHSIFFSKLYKWVYSFEPHPLTLKLLNLNVQLFSNNITVFPIGLSDKEDSIPFFLAKNANMMGAKLVYSDSNKYNEDDIMNVKVFCLDQLDELKGPEIGLIKIDVEGAEINVLSGGKEILTRNKPVILFEQHLNDFHDGKSKVIDYLKGMGYSFYIIKTTPIRSRYNSVLKRVSNLFVELAAGRKYEIKQCENFKPDFYNMIIAVHA
jgi:FkbM family methyltransferase